MYISYSYIGFFFFRMGRPKKDPADVKSNAQMCRRGGRGRRPSWGRPGSEERGTGRPSSIPNEGTPGAPRERRTEKARRDGTGRLCKYYT